MTVDPFLIPVPASEMQMSDPPPDRPARRWGPGLAGRIEIAAALDCSEAAVRARARREGWPRIARLAAPRGETIYRAIDLPADVREALGEPEEPGA